MKALDVTIVELATIVSLCYNIPAVLWDPCSMAAPVCHQLIHWSFHLTLANPPGTCHSEEVAFPQHAEA